MGMFRNLVQNGASQIDEAFNQPPYEFVMGKKGAGDIFFTFQEEEEGKEFRIQFYGSAGMGKNVRRVFIGEKVGGNTYKNIIKKFKNPLRVVATLVAATEEFLITPVGMKVEGFAVFIPAVAGARIDDFLKLLFKRNAKLRSKLELLDTKFQFEERGYYLWAVRKGKNPAQVFNGEKVAGMFPDAAADIEPEVAPAPAPVAKPTTAPNMKSADYGEWNVFGDHMGFVRTKSTGRGRSSVVQQFGFDLGAENVIVHYRMGSASSVVSNVISTETDVISFVNQMVGSSYKDVDYGKALSHYSKNIAHLIGARAASATALEQESAPVPKWTAGAGTKWVIGRDFMELKNGKAAFKMASDGSIKFKEAGAMRDVSSSFIESKADILDFMNSAIPKRLKNADFAAASEEFADILVAGYGFSGTAPAKVVKYSFDGNIETYQKILNEVVANGSTVEEAIGVAAVNGWDSENLPNALLERILRVPGVSVLDRDKVLHPSGNLIHIELSNNNFFKVDLESHKVEYKGMYQDSSMQERGILQIWDCLRDYMTNLARDISIAEIAADKILPRGYREGVFRFKIKFHSGSPARLYVKPISDEAKEVFGMDEYKTIWFASDVGGYAKARLKEYLETTDQSGAEAFSNFIEKVRFEPYIDSVDAKELEDGVVYARAGVYEIEFNETDDAGEVDVYIERGGKSIARATGSAEKTLELMRYHLGHLAKGDEKPEDEVGVEDEVGAEEEPEVYYDPERIKHNFHEAARVLYDVDRNVRVTETQLGYTYSVNFGGATRQKLKLVVVREGYNVRSGVAELSLERMVNERFRQQQYKVLQKEDVIGLVKFVQGFITEYSLATEPTSEKPSSDSLLSRVADVISSLDFVVHTDYEQFEQGEVTLTTIHLGTNIEIVDRGNKVAVEVVNEDDSLFVIRGDNPARLAKELREFFTFQFDR